MLDLNSMLIDDQDAALAAMAVNSYRDFHAPGLDYLCLHRSPAMTVKAYFFDRGAVGAPVMPHNHRYDFYTQVLAGHCVHTRFRLCDATDPSPFIQTFQRRDWTSPLFGEPLFQSGWSRRADNTLARLRPMRENHGPGSGYFVSVDEIHDIDVTSETVLLLTQFPSRIPRDKPTSTYFPLSVIEPAPLKGLYQPMTPSQCAMRYGQIMDLIGG